MRSRWQSSFRLGSSSRSALPSSRRTRLRPPSTPHRSRHWAGAVSARPSSSSSGPMRDTSWLSLARLSYAMARDALFPAPFAKIHPRFHTPYLGIAFQAVCALVGSLLFDLRGLIAISVFFLGLCYVATAASALRLVQRHPDRRLLVPALRPALFLAA